LAAYDRQRKDVQQKLLMTEIRLRAYRKIGELSNALERIDAETRFGSDGVSTGGHPANFRRSRMRVSGMPSRTAARSSPPSMWPTSRLLSRGVASVRASLLNELLHMVGKAKMREKKTAAPDPEGASLPQSTYHVL
jgi:hypothetical protein